MVDKSIGWFRKAIDAIHEAEEKLGFKTILRWLVLIGVVLLVIFIKPVTKHVVEFYSEISENYHIDRMKIRDKYMTGLNPLLIELRTENDADRVLYFEYHNSEQSLDKTPFKFFDLMSSNVKHSIVGTIPQAKFKDVNASQFQDVYNDIRGGKILYCHGPEDTEFRNKYQGIYELFNQIDKSQQLIIFSVPGVNTPIGFITLEWMNDSVKIDENKIKESVHHILPKINAVANASKQ